MNPESILSVLMYLFRHHMQDSVSLDEPEESLFPILEDAGFDRPIIIQAFNWLANLIESETVFVAEPSSQSTRVFSQYELDLINPECRSFLMQLTELGILNAKTREIVIDQILQLEEEGIDLNLVKWVTLMVLFNQSKESTALSYMEFLVLDKNSDSELAH